MRLLVLPLLLSATWYVKPGGNGNGSQASPFGTVQQGLNAADAGDTVILAAGTYAENPSVTKNGITLTSVTPGAAVIDGTAGAAQGKPALSIHGSGWEIDGVVFIDGGVEDLSVSGNGNCPAAGGVTLRQIRTSGAVMPASRNCLSLPDAGDPDSYGVRVSCLQGPVVVEQSRFLTQACTANLWLDSVGPRVLVQQNELTGAHVMQMVLNGVDGGEVTRNDVHAPGNDGRLGNGTSNTFGIHLTTCQNVWVHHNRVVGTGQYGIGAFDSKNALANEQIDISNNTLIGEECGVRYNAVSGEAHSNLVFGGACADAGCDNPCGKPCAVAVLNNVGGSAVDVSVGFDLFDPAKPGIPYCLMSGQVLVDAGPVLSGSPSFVDAGGLDFHLTATSPAIDQADPATPAGLDFDGLPEPVPGAACRPARADIGAYEFQTDAGCDAGTADAGTLDGGAARPIAVVSPPSQGADAGLALTLDGSGSRPSPGATLTGFAWTEIEGPSGVRTGSAAMQEVTLEVPGTYVFQLVVTDSTGQSSAPATGSIDVAGDTSPPGYRSGCGCGAPGAFTGASLLLLLAAGLRGIRRSGRPAR